MNHCPHCGAALEEHARYCTYCMTTLTDKQFIANPMRVSARLLTLLTAAFLMLVCALSVCAFVLYPPQDQPSDSTIRRPSHPLSSQAVIFASDDSPSSSAQASESSDPFFDFSSFLNESSSSDSFSASYESQTPPSSALSSPSSEMLSSPQSSTTSSSSSFIPKIGGRVFSVDPPAGLQPYPIYVSSVDHYIQEYNATGNHPELLTNAGLRKNENVIMIGVDKLAADHCYYVPEKVGDYTVVSLGYFDSGAAHYDFMGGSLTMNIKKIYTPPSCRLFLDALCSCPALTDIYIAADSFYLHPLDLPEIIIYNDYHRDPDNFIRPITIHAKPDAWNEYAGMTMAEYMSNPHNGYRCRFEAWDPSTVY